MFLKVKIKNKNPVNIFCVLRMFLISRKLLKTDKIKITLLKDSATY